MFGFVMKYWQVSMRRMSRAANKLDMDGAWHPFATGEHSWYRVWNRKTIQRTQFRDAIEQDLLLPMLADFEPLSELEQVSGFREEVRIDVIDDTFQIGVILGYPLTGKPQSQALNNAAKRHKITISTEETLLLVFVPLEGLTALEITRAQQLLSALRLFYQTLGTENAAAIGAANLAFERMVSAD
jgi:hypothetical protein